MRLLSTPLATPLFAVICSAALSGCGAGGAGAGAVESSALTPPSPPPTTAPTPAPTPAPTAAPTPAPTSAPTPAPTPAPTLAPPKLKLLFNVDQTRNNQGLSYSAGFYYVSYDIGSGNGYVERYSKDGVVDPGYGRAAVPTAHTAGIAYRSADGRLYAASGGGTEPTYVFKLAADGKSVERTYDFKKYGNSALMAFDNVRDLLILSSTQSGGDLGPVTVRFIDLNSADFRVVAEFTIPSIGVPQGVAFWDGLIYYYTNNKISVLDQAGSVLDDWTLQAAGESEGIAVVTDGSEVYLAVGYNSPRRVYAIRPIQLGSKAPLAKHYVIPEG